MKSAAGTARCQTSSSSTPSIVIAAVVRIAVTCLRPSGDVSVDCANANEGSDSAQQIVAAMRTANGTTQCNPLQQSL